MLSAPGAPSFIYATVFTVLPESVQKIRYQGHKLRVFNPEKGRRINAHEAREQRTKKEESERKDKVGASRRISSRINICGSGCGRRLRTRRKGRSLRQGDRTNNERDVGNKWGGSVLGLTAATRYLRWCS